MVKEIEQCNILYYYIIQTMYRFIITDLKHYKSFENSNMHSVVINAFYIYFDAVVWDEIH